MHIKANKWGLFGATAATEVVKSLSKGRPTLVETAELVCSGQYEGIGFLEHSFESSLG